MHEFKAHFQLLELDQTASLDDIKQAYRDLVMVWHPDRFAHNVRLQHKAEDKLKQFNCAYEYLKRWYDGTRQGHTRTASHAASAPRTQPSASKRQPHTSSGTASAQQQSTVPPRQRAGDLLISFTDAQYILRRYCFVPLKRVCNTQQEYQSGPFTLLIRENPLEITLAVPCNSLQNFDRILLSIPCKSTGHFDQEEAQLLSRLLQVQAV
jgi:hypothetical protein